MAIAQNLAAILAAKYGRDVRQAIHDGIQECYIDVTGAVSATNAAADLANTKAGLANDAADLANTKAGLANDAADLANTKAGLADTAKGRANDAADLANTKAGLANDAADLANTKAGLANTATQEANAAKGLANKAAQDADEATSEFTTYMSGVPATIQGLFEDLGFTKVSGVICVEVERA